MPQAEGPTLIRAVRETHPEVKAIFVSGYTEDPFRQRLGADSELHVLSKPFSRKQLAGSAKEAMEERRPNWLG